MTISRVLDPGRIASFAQALAGEPELVDAPLGSRRRTRLNSFIRFPGTSKGTSLFCSTRRFFNRR